MLVERRTFPIPRFPAPFVNLLSESHEFLRDSGVAEVCSSSPMKKAMNSASVVSALKARTVLNLGFARTRWFEAEFFECGGWSRTFIKRQRILTGLTAFN